MGYFALTGRMAEMFGWKNKNNRYKNYGGVEKKIDGIYGVSPTTARGGLLISNERKDQTESHK